MNSLMHIGLVGPLPPPFGGMANQTRQLAELLRSEGLTVSLVQTNAEYRPHWVSRLPLIRALCRLLPYIFALWQQAGRCHVMHVMANSGWSWHLFAAPAIWIAKLRRTPVIVHYHGGEAEAFFAESTRLAHLTMCKASAVIVPSKFLQTVFARFGISAEIIPNAVDLDRFQNSAPHQLTRRHFLVARNLEPIYDNETAIRAFLTVHRKHPDATLTIAGSGPLADLLHALAEHLGLANAVVFTGRLDRDAMALAYRKADIAINPSLVDNMPGSVLEALASGLPVISTNVGGVPFIVTDEETALLVPPKSPDAMAEAMFRLIHDPALSSRLVDNGLAEVQKYTWQRIWPLLANVYRQTRNNISLPV
jgi:L-malate glycosyltransferase